MTPVNNGIPQGPCAMDNEVLNQVLSHLLPGGVIRNQILGSLDRSKINSALQLCKGIVYNCVQQKNSLRLSVIFSQAASTE